MPFTILGGKPPQLILFPEETVFSILSNISSIFIPKNVHDIESYGNTKGAEFCCSHL